LASATASASLRRNRRAPAAAARRPASARRRARSQGTPAHRPSRPSDDAPAVRRPRRIVLLADARPGRRGHARRATSRGPADASACTITSSSPSLRTRTHRRPASTAPSGSLPRLRSSTARAPRASGRRTVRGSAGSGCNRPRDSTGPPPPNWYRVALVHRHTGSGARDSDFGRTQRAKPRAAASLSGALDETRDHAVLDGRGCPLGTRVPVGTSEAAGLAPRRSARYRRQQASDG
jgi:hypothetical protein